MVFTEVINKAKKEATIRLYGMIGKDIDGNLFARELAGLDTEVDTINLRINSEGGSVLQGFSILSVMLTMKAFIHVYIDGVAASMGAVIAICGDKISIMDYAREMIHDPFFTGANQDNLSPKEKKALDGIKDSLRRILSRRGCDKDKIAELMEKETWFSSEEALAAGLVDEIVSTARKEEFKNLSTTEIISRVRDEYKPLNNDIMALKKIAAKLGLPETATEKEIMDKITSLETSEGNQPDAAKITNHYLDLGKTLGTVTDKNEEKLKKLAALDFDLFADMILEGVEVKEGKKKEERSKPATPSRLSAVLEAVTRGAAATGANSGDTKTWDWYQRNDPQALSRMETENPTTFKKLLDVYENSL